MGGARPRTPFTHSTSTSKAAWNSRRFQALLCLGEPTSGLCYVLSQWASEPEAQAGYTVLAAVLGEQRYARRRFPPLNEVLLVYDLPSQARPPAAPGAIRPQ